MLIGNKLCPTVGDIYARYTGKLAYLLQFLFTGQIIANIMEIDLTVLFGLGVLDQQGDRNWCPASQSKDIILLMYRTLSGKRINNTV